MAGADATGLTARLLLPDLLERGRANALSCPLYQDGALVAPTSGTVSIYDTSNTAVVDTQAVTVTGSIATYSYTPASTLALDEGWRVEWALTVATVTHLFRNAGALVRARLYPVIADVDLFRRVRGLDPSGTSPLSTVSDYQDYRDEAWAEIQLRLISKGRRPNLVMEPSALRQVHLWLALHNIFDDFAGTLSETFQTKADTYRSRYEEAWSQLSFSYDEDDDGVAEPGKKSALPVYWLTSR